MINIFKFAKILKLFYYDKITKLKAIYLNISKNRVLNINKYSLKVNYYRTIIFIQ
jgi:hypothetical protein